MDEQLKSIHSREGEPSAVIDRGWRASLSGLATALCFAISPIFIRHGLQDLPSPLLGVTIGMIFSTLAYGIAFFFRRRTVSGETISRGTLFYQFLAGVLVGLSTWARWFALDLAPVGVVVALGRLNVPIVIGLSPLVLGQQLERVTLKIWLGAALILAGAFILAINT